MENNGLKPEIVDKIKSDPLLYGKIADALGIAAMSLPRVLYSNSSKLTQINVLRILKEHLGVQDNDLLLILEEA